MPFHGKPATPQRQPLHPGHAVVAPITHIPFQYVPFATVDTEDLDPKLRGLFNSTKQGIARLQMTGMMGPLPAGDVVDVLNQMLAMIKQLHKTRK